MRKYFWTDNLSPVSLFTKDVGFTDELLLTTLSTLSLLASKESHLALADVCWDASEVNNVWLFRCFLMAIHGLTRLDAFTKQLWLSTLCKAKIRSSAMTAQAPASSAIFACSLFITSTMTWWCWAVAGASSCICKRRAAIECTSGQFLTHKDLVANASLQHGRQTLLHLRSSWDERTAWELRQQRCLNNHTGPEVGTRLVPSATVASAITTFTTQGFQNRQCSLTCTVITQCQIK